MENYNRVISLTVKSSGNYNRVISLRVKSSGNYNRVISLRVKSSGNYNRVISLRVKSSGNYNRVISLRVKSSGNYNRVISLRVKSSGKLQSNDLTLDFPCFCDHWESLVVSTRFSSAQEDLLAQLAPGAGQSGRAEREKLIKERGWEAENGLRNGWGVSDRFLGSMFFTWVFCLNQHFIFGLWFKMACSFAFLPSSGSIATNGMILPLTNLQPTARCVQRRRRRHGLPNWTAGSLSAGSIHLSLFLSTESRYHLWTHCKLWRRDGQVSVVVSSFFFFFSYSSSPSSSVVIKKSSSSGFGMPNRQCLVLDGWRDL